MSIYDTNLLDIKREPDTTAPSPIIIKNTVAKTEFIDIKQEPEDSHFMEVNSHDRDSQIGSYFDRNESYHHEVGRFDDLATQIGTKNGSNKNFLMISAVTQNYRGESAENGGEFGEFRGGNGGKGEFAEILEKSSAKLKIHPKTDKATKTSKVRHKSKEAEGAPLKKKQKVDKKMQKVENLSKTGLKIKIRTVNTPKAKKSTPKDSSDISSYLVKLEPVENMPVNEKPVKKAPAKANTVIITSVKAESAIPHQLVNLEQPQIPLFIPIPDHLRPDPIPFTKKRRTILFECDHCGKVFKSKYTITWHMKAHMLTMPYNCGICGKGFTYERSFKQHELTHASKVPCDVCGKKLKPHALYYHMKYKHTDERTHKCPICPKYFKTKDNVTRHLMRHNMDFDCNLCGRKFPENSRLQMHLRMHESPEEFLCTICNKSFEHIDRHMKRLHGKKRERNLKCKYCEYMSDCKQTITRHEEKHEMRKEIEKSKKRKSRKMMKLAVFECKVCNVSLQTKQGYKSHLRHYHNGNDVNSEESQDKSSIEDENFVEIKIEKEEVSVIQ